MLCAAACGCRGAAAGVPRVYRDGRRPSSAAGDEVKINPPRLAIWLLSIRLRDEWREFVVGDLEEEFETRSGGSRLAARGWFWWQTMRCLVAPPTVRPHTRQLEPVRGDSTMRRVIADVRYALATDAADAVLRPCGDRCPCAWHTRQHRDRH